MVLCCYTHSILFILIILTVADDCGDDTDDDHCEDQTVQVTVDQHVQVNTALENHTGTGSKH